MAKFNREQTYYLQDRLRHIISNKLHQFKETLPKLPTQYDEGKLVDDAYIAAVSKITISGPALVEMLNNGGLTKTNLSKAFPAIGKAIEAAKAKAEKHKAEANDFYRKNADAEREFERKIRAEAQKIEDMIYFGDDATILQALQGFEAAKLEKV